jgi:dienelactone hydrolase
MKKLLLTMVLSAFIISGTIFSGCVQNKSPAKKTDTELALEIVTDLTEKNYTEVYKYFDSSITSQLTAEQFQNVWEQEVVAIYGNITLIVSTRLTNESGYQNVYVTCTFSKIDEMDVRIIFNSQQLVLSLTVVPTPVVYEPPSYVNQSAFTEESVTVGSGEWVLPGNLTVPKGTGPFSAVVLVQGSGPNDQDETIGPNKPFKDIAWGLASQGIVVLRYVKRTKEYPQKALEVKNFTVEDEVIDDVIAAINLLNETIVVDHSQIFVLGHSLGGYLAPRIASQDNLVAGLIILAGPTRPLEDLILEQTRYLANLSGVNDSAQIVALQENITKIKTLNFTDNEFVLGAPASYWRDLATYDPVATAQTLHIPMLIMQGLRDYQVTLQDFDRWNETFYNNKNVTLKTYPSLNHLFMAGTGVPTNTEYLIPGHVAEEVIDEISSWIKTH